MEYARKNTVKVRFGEQCRSPSDAEMISFVARNMGIKPDQVSHLYYDHFERCIVIKFTGETLMKMCIEKHVGEKIFAYTSGQSCKVTITDGNEEIKYVRIFYLPPEIPDREIHDFVLKFGSVKRIVHEKRPISSGFSCYSGVRGVYMDVRKEIPAQLYICNYRCRVYYSGMQEKCFSCKATDHLKSNCPNRHNTVEQEAVKSNLCPRKRVNASEEAMKMNFTILPSKHVGLLGKRDGETELGSSSMTTDIDNEVKSISDAAEDIDSTNLSTNGDTEQKSNKESEWTMVKSKLNKAVGASGVVAATTAVATSVGMAAVAVAKPAVGSTTHGGKKEMMIQTNDPVASCPSVEAKGSSDGGAIVLVSNRFEKLNEEAVDDESLECDTKRRKKEQIQV